MSGGLKQTTFAHEGDIQLQYSHDNKVRRRSWLVGRLVVGLPRKLRPPLSLQLRAAVADLALATSARPAVLSSRLPRRALTRSLTSVSRRIPVAVGRPKRSWRKQLTTAAAPRRSRSVALLGREPLLLLSAVIRTRVLAAVRRQRSNRWARRLWKVAVEAERTEKRICLVPMLREPALPRDVVLPKSCQRRTKRMPTAVMTEALVQPLNQPKPAATTAAAPSQASRRPKVPKVPAAAREKPPPAATRLA